VARTVRVLCRTGEVTLITHELTTNRRTLLRDGSPNAATDRSAVRDIQTALAALARHHGRTLAAELSGRHIPLRIFVYATC